MTAHVGIRPLGFGLMKLSWCCLIQPSILIAKKMCTRPENWVCKLHQETLVRIYATEFSRHRSLVTIMIHSCGSLVVFGCYVHCGASGQTQTTGLFRRKMDNPSPELTIRSPLQLQEQAWAFLGQPIHLKIRPTHPHKIMVSWIPKLANQNVADFDMAGPFGSLEARGHFDLGGMWYLTKRDKFANSWKGLASDANVHSAHGAHGSTIAVQSMLHVSLFSTKLNSLRS